MFGMKRRRRAKIIERRAKIIERLEEIDHTSVWHSEPDYDRLVEELARIDGSPYNGHYYWNCCVKTKPYNESEYL